MSTLVVSRLHGGFTGFVSLETRLKNDELSVLHLDDCLRACFARGTRCLERKNSSFLVDGRLIASSSVVVMGLAPPENERKDHINTAFQRCRLTLVGPNYVQ